MYSKLSNVPSHGHYTCTIEYTTLVYGVSLRVSVEMYWKHIPVQNLVQGSAMSTVETAYTDNRNNYQKRNFHRLYWELNYVIPTPREVPRGSPVFCTKRRATVAAVHFETVKFRRSHGHWILHSMYL